MLYCEGLVGFGIFANKRRFGLAAFCALLSTTGALAADRLGQAGYSWTGGYVGVNLGYGWGDLRDVANPNADPKNLEGIIVGAQIGYNWQLDNNVVIGVELDASLGNVKNAWIDPGQYSGYYTQDKIDALGTLRGRLGFAVDRVLPYVTGGLAVGRTNHVLGCSPDFVPANAGSCYGNPNRVFEDSNSSTRVGYSLGAGMEYALDDKVSLKAEYLYTDLGKKSVVLVDPAYSNLSDRNFSTDFHTVRLGVNFKF